MLPSAMHAAVVVQVPPATMPVDADTGPQQHGVVGVAAQPAAAMQCVGGSTQLPLPSHMPSRSHEVPWPWSE